MQDSGNKKRKLNRSRTAHQQRKKSGRNSSDTIEQIKPDYQYSKQEERYKILVENIPCAFYSALPGETGPTIFISNKWADLTGYSPEELYQDPESWPKCIHPDDREKTVNAYIRACRDGASYKLEYRVIHKSTGQLSYVRDQGILSKDQKDDIVRVDGIITDISELTRAGNELIKYRGHLEELVKERTAELARANEVLKLQDAERKKAEEALEESVQFSRTIVTSVAEGVIVSDLELRYSVWNKFMEDLTGMSAKDVLGKRALELFPHLREQGIDKLFERALAGETVHSPDTPYWIPGTEKRGWYVGTYGPHTAPNGEIIGVVGLVRNITERKEAEEALRESESRYKAVIDNAAEGIVVVQDNMIRFVNSHVIAIIGYSEKEMTSRSFIEFVCPDDREQVMKIHLKRLKGEEVPEVYEFRIVDKQNNTKWLENNGILIEWGGRPATLNFLRDITERKKTEEELKKQKYYLEKAQDIGTMGTWELDIEKNILVWTDENYQIFGVPTGTELTYEAFLDCVHPDDREYVDKKWKAALNKEPYDIEHRILIDGEVKWVREKAELDFDEKGNCVRGIGFTQDITERYKAEEALKKSEENYRLANQAAGIVVWRVITPDLKVESGGALEHMLGYKEGEIQDWYDVAHPDDRERLRGLWASIINDDLARYDVEHRMIHKDGRILWVSINSEVKKDDKGFFLYIIGTTQDITERKKAEEKLLDYQAKLKSLASQLSLIEERERHYIATELHDQIGQSLVFSKTKLDSMRSSISSGELADSLEEVSDCLGQVIRDTRTLTFELSYPILYELGFEAAVSEWLDEQIRRNHGIKTEFEDDRQPKLLDDDIRALLFRNVRELLINVVKHANARKVKVSICKVDSQICVSVEDDGVGIEPTEVASLACENVGFGIFSIRERLEQLGGHLEIDSEKGCGSKITMTAPLKL